MTQYSSTHDRYALVGHPVEHSRSPLIHRLFARQTRQPMTYELIDALPEAFEVAVRGFVAEGGCGLNVTVPHKEAAYALMDEVGEAAAAAGAVNTISALDGGRLRGDNTDGVGLLRDLTANLRQPIVGRSVLILGAGGAARGIVGPLLEARPRQLVIANRTRERAAVLVEHFDSRPPLRSAGFDELATLRPFDVTINATSAGLHGELPPFPGTLVGPQSFCYDLVYSVNDTPFVTWARRHGAAHTAQGWGMLVEQAAESFFIWRGVRPDTGPVRKQLVL